MSDTIKNNKKIIHSLTEDLILLDIDSIDIFTHVFELMKKHIKFDAATFYLFNTDNEKLEKVTSYNEDVEILIGLQIECGDGLSAWSADSAQTILIADRTKKKSYNPDTDYASFLSIPILKNNILYAVINLGSFKKNNFTNEDIQCIETASPAISYIADHYQLLKKYNYIRAEYMLSVDKFNSLNNSLISDSISEIISEETAQVIHGINNALSIILGNLQCLLIGKNEFNQKSLSRLKRIEEAAKKISESNIQILNLNTLVNKKSDKNSSTIKTLAGIE